MSEKLITKLATTLTDLPYQTWNFGDSVAFDALVEASDVLGSERWAGFAHGWARSWLAQGRPWRRLDCTAPGRAMAKLAQRYQDHQLIDGLVDLAAYLADRPRLSGVFETWESSPLRQPYGPMRLDTDGTHLLTAPPAGVFVDCLHFDPPFFAALARTTGDASFSALALSQARGYIDLLQREDGLFDHFVLRGVPGRFGPGWGRGQGWALLGLLEVIEELGPSTWAEAGHDDVRYLADAVGRLIDALVDSQQPSGHWPAVVGVADSGAEHSTAAFAAAGLYRALLLGLVDERSRVQRCAERAASATAQAIDPDGALTEVSAAVEACTLPDHYAWVPRGFRVPWGQGPALLAFAARQRWEAQQ